MTVTDANLVLGRLQATYFPKIFGAEENESLDYEGAKAAFEELLQKVNEDLAATGAPSKTVEELALGFLEVANEAMCRPIRSLTEAKGHRASDHELAVFGGAGGQHACVSGAPEISCCAKLITVRLLLRTLELIGFSSTDILQSCPPTGWLWQIWSTMSSSHTLQFWALPRKIWIPD